MANCVKCRFSLNLKLFSVVLKNVPVKYIATYCPWDSHQIHSSCTSMSLWWQNNLSLWLSWTVSIPKWVSIYWHAACAPSDAKLLEGGVDHTLTSQQTSRTSPSLMLHIILFCVLWRISYPEPVVIQLQSSGNPVCLEHRPQCTLECHWRKNCL